MTSSILTRWLWQGLELGLCPLCRASHKLDRRFMWHFFDSASMNDLAVEGVARARGFCPDHAEQWRRIEVEGMRSTLGISEVYMAVLEYLHDNLAVLGPDDVLTREGCPACVSRDVGVASNARYLLEELVNDPVFRDRFAASPALCVPHFQLASGIAGHQEERELLTAIQRDATRRLIDELQEHVRKQLADAKGEPEGVEADSWQRALWTAGGWPAPTRPASVPEGEDPYGRSDGADALSPSAESSPSPTAGPTGYAKPHRPRSS